MAHAIRYHRYGGPDVLAVEEVPMPEAGDGEVVVEVFATGLNPIESVTRRGDGTPGDDGFPRGQGRDLAGVVASVGPGVTGFAAGDAVMGYVDAGAQASHVVVPAGQLMRKPASVPWEVAGSLYTAGTMAWSAVEGLALTPGDTVVVTAAAGGAGCLAAQFALLRGATVVGTSADARLDFLAQYGIIPLGYGPGLAARVRERAPGPVTAFLDFLGGEAPEGIALGVSPSRIVTVLDRAAVEQHGIAAVEPGDLVALRRVTDLVAAHRVRLPIADVFPVERVADAYRALDRRDAPGKIVLGFHVVHYEQQRVREPDVKEQDVTLGVPTPHGHIDVEESVPPVIGDGRVRARHRAEREERDARRGEATDAAEERRD
ncbi:NADP-dependent oxidoreductase [Agromyces aurantiacus]|uniref:NADP-dependent oxidoreductase n=1 Tax=Agromyces aurantiacus TaxID=165814 RepID=A0ABV9R9L2_9MICO|nr:NADP-dependent oxidoreductase [Agromyces aurantiacus]MBM7505440.1 NADPH:quinone reductase-like Zn-dependent oxidoreductase [Agromyces aurantiacus]